MLQYWIWLSSIKGLSCRSQAAVIRHFGDAESVYLADALSYRSVSGLSTRDAELLNNKDMTNVQTILTACTNMEIHIITYQDAAYPERLRQIADPPMVLYYRGSLPAFDVEPVICVVGTRDASAYGLFCSTRLGYQIASCGGTVLSGMARGIDASSIQGALTAGKPVVGVLGCGVDVVYPRQNASLLLDVQKHGCLISEYPPGTPPLASHFPVRNRILSGLSVGVLVVEAAEKSGALITAAHALEQGRDVFAIPGNIGVESSAGSNRLIRDGAELVTCGWDIMQNYEALFPGKVTQPIQKERNAAVYMQHSDQPSEQLRVASPVLTPRPVDKNNVDKKKSKDYIDLKKVMSGLSEDEKRIVEALQEKELHVDDLIEHCQVPAARILAALTLLEVKGYVRRLPGKRFCLIIEKA